VKITTRAGMSPVTAAVICLGMFTATAEAQTAGAASRPDPREIPVPPIATAMGRMPGVAELPIREEMPDVLVMNDGTRVRTPRQWQTRRDEMRRIL
jgi:hypothetical protein